MGSSFILDLHIDMLFFIKFIFVVFGVIKTIDVLISYFRIRGAQKGNNSKNA